jgi:hypothetical protein
MCTINEIGLLIFDLFISRRLTECFLEKLVGLNVVLGYRILLSVFFLLSLIR